MSASSPGAPPARLIRGLDLPLAIAALAFALPVLASGDPYGLRLLTLSGVYALLGIGYVFAFGHAGLLSLAQGAFFGLGAYATGILASRWGIARIAGAWSRHTWWRGLIC